MLSEKELTEKFSKIKLLLMDCDGVLTDGKITFLPSGDEQKTFHVRDGQGLVLLHNIGIKTGIISGRNSSLVDRRARELKIEFVRQGVKNKVDEYEDIASIIDVNKEETAYIGDDINDLALLKEVGLAIAVGDAINEVKQCADYITTLDGGNGAIREICDLIVFSKNNLNLLDKNKADA